MIDFDLVFAKMNEELIVINETFELICAGGYVMQRNGYRSTTDVDAFYSSSIEIDEIIRRVGDLFNINREDELWLNNSISNMNQEPSLEYCDMVIQLSNLKVLTVKLDYLIGMKLLSAREQDIIDVATILKQNNNKEPLQLRIKLFQMGFDIDISLLLDAYEYAYGIEWLDEFYRDFEHDIRELY